jgi:GWxTD domain-containing protein
MKRWLGLSILGLAVWVLVAGPAQAEKIKLPERHRKWLEEEVTYIITPRERDVFLKLETDRERDAFIEAFWKQRDPTPGTPQNEFKTEHYRRLSYANDFYGRGTPRPGWRTDRGRTYIVLGPPKGIETYDEVNGVYPTEIWFYQADPGSGLPPAFNIMFFKERGMGDYVFYSPSQNGPRSLVADSMEMYQDDRAAYQTLQSLEPNLAWQTLSLIPSEHVPVGTVSLASNTLMSNVFSAPLAKVDDAYAEALLRYKDAVEVEYTANYIGCEAQTLVAGDGAGGFAVHYSVEPGKLSLDQLGDKFSANFDLNGRLTDPQGRTVYQFDKKFGLELDPSELQSVQATGLALQDMFPVLPGEYKFDLLVKNTVSKEFATYETSLSVPVLPSEAPVLGPPLLAYALQPGRLPAGEKVPFNLGSEQALSQARDVFVPADTLFLVFQVYGLPTGWDSAGRLRFQYLKDGRAVITRDRTPTELAHGEALIESQALGAFAPGYYDLRLSLLDPEGREVQSRTAHFEVSYVSSLARPRILARVVRPDQRGEWDYALGLQALNKGLPDLARSHLSRAFSSNPRDVSFGLGYAQCLFVLKDYQGVLDALRPLLEVENVSPDVSAWMGRASHALARFQEAIGFYRDYLARAGTNLEIMNYMGSCYFQLGDKAQALATWRKSLEVNPNQEQLRRLVDSLSK